MIEDSTRISLDLISNGIKVYTMNICNWLHFDWNNKVFKGSTDYVENGYSEENDAVNKIIEIANKNDKTYILAIGAITNELTESNHKITVVNYLNVDKIYKDLFEKLGEN